MIRFTFLYGREIGDLGHPPRAETAWSTAGVWGALIAMQLPGGERQGVTGRVIHNRTSTV